jgi:hypothetical protein
MYQYTAIFGRYGVLARRFAGGFGRATRVAAVRMGFGLRNGWKQRLGGESRVGSYRGAGPINRGGVVASDKAVVDLEEGRQFWTATARGRCGGAGGCARVARTTTGGGADKVWLFFVCLCPSKEMKPIFYKQILHPNIKKIVYE